eukprot:scaffold21815_cov55-Phaeocystis_antarctica.AAC.3
MRSRNFTPPLRVTAKNLAARAATERLGSSSWWDRGLLSVQNPGIQIDIDRRVDPPCHSLAACSRAGRFGAATCRTSSHASTRSVASPCGRE